VDCGLQDLCPSGMWGIWTNAFVSSSILTLVVDHVTMIFYALVYCVSVFVLDHILIEYVDRNLSISHNITIHFAAYVYIGDNSCVGYKVCWYTDVRGAAVTVGDNLCVGAI
jgi:hypothetical protein